MTQTEKGGSLLNLLVVLVVLLLLASYIAEQINQSSRLGAPKTDSIWSKSIFHTQTPTPSGNRSDNPPVRTTALEDTQVYPPKNNPGSYPLQESHPNQAPAPQNVYLQNTVVQQTQEIFIVENPQPQYIPYYRPVPVYVPYQQPVNPYPFVPGGVTVHSYPTQREQRMNLGVWNDGARHRR